MGARQSATLEEGYDSRLSLAAESQLKPDLHAKKPWLTIAIIAALLSIAVGAVSGMIEWKYMLSHPFFFDPVAYMYYSAQAYENLIRHGPLQAAWLEYSSPARAMPLRTIPLILFSPSLLTKPLGELGTAIPAFYCLVWLFGITAFKRTKSLGYAIACMLMYAALPCVYSPIFGLATFWLDVVSGIFIGCAALCVVNYADTAKNKWLVFFSLFVSAATLSRYVSIAYALIACYPTLMLLLFIHFREGIKRKVAAPAAILTLVPAFLIGLFLISRLKVMYAYYTVFGYAWKQELPRVISDTQDWLKNIFLGHNLEQLLFLLIGVNLIGYVATKRKDKSSIVAIALPLLTFFAFYIFGLRSGSSGYVLWHAVPLIMTAALIPLFPIRNAGQSDSTSGGAGNTLKGSRRAWLKAIPWSVALVAVFFGAFSIGDGYVKARRSDREARGLKQLDQFMAGQIGKFVKPTEAWEAYFDECSTMPSMECFFETKQYHPGASLFTKHLSYWKGWYKGLPVEEVSRRVYAETKKRVSVAFVCDDPKTPYAQGCWWLNNEYSKGVASFMAAKLQSDPGWRKVAEVDSVQYGKVAVYKNLSEVAQLTWE